MKACERDKLTDATTDHSHPDHEDPEEDVTASHLQLGSESLMFTCLRQREGMKSLTEEKEERIRNKMDRTELY